MSDRPLWRLLLDLKAAVPPQPPLTCAECFALLEYLAEALSAETAVDHQEQLQSAIQKHLTVCPNCRAAYEKRLAQMEQLYRLLNKP
ncbi:hypothetical protein [Candidatus Leptofilum sp.]|uniref:hypothetical protein n=1 Tax=Candidatus Leptofilum sp. TaxID=3241576 RepID=UPI003B5AA702